jgi:PqqD family protein of HPr-rel-A system
VRREASFRAFGFRFALDADDPALDALLGELYALCRDHTDGTDGTDGAGAVHHLEVRRTGREHRLLLDGEVLVATPDPALVLAQLVWQVNQAAVAAAGDGLALHAAGVARDGRAAVLSGGTGAGKSTLAARLVADGCAYLGDEAVLLGAASSAVVAYPKPLTLEAPSWPLLRLGDLDPVAAPYQRVERQVAPGELRAGATSAAAAPTLVVVLDPTAPGGLAPMRRAETVAALAGQSFNLHTLGPAGFARLVRAVAAARCERLGRTDLAAASATIRALLSEAAPPPTPTTITTTSDPASRALAERALSTQGPRVRGALEVAEIDGEAVVFDPAAGKVHHLNASAFAVWRALDGTRGPAEVARAIAEELAVAEPEVRAHVGRLVDDLAREGLLAT